MIALPIPLAAWSGRSLGARIIALFLGLLLVVEVISFMAVRASLEAHTRHGLPARLDTDERVLERLLEQKAAKLTEGARLLVADYGFRSAVLSNDAATIASVLENHGARIGATETALVGTDFSLRVASGRDTPELLPLIGRLAAQAAGSGAASEITLLDGKPHVVVLVPMKAPVLVGWVLTGFPLDTHLSADMKGLSAHDLTVLTRSHPGEPWTVAFSSLPADIAAGLQRERWPSPGVAMAPMQSAALAKEEFGVRAKWLTPPPRPGETDHAGVLALVSLSIDDAVRLPRDLQIRLLYTTLLGLVVFVLGSLFTTRHVTTPLRQLSSAAERLGAGDYMTPMGGLRRHDEFGQLAQAFEKMRVSVGEKQAQILQLAYWDSLTGLPNRAQFRDAVRAAIAEARTNLKNAHLREPGSPERRERRPHTSVAILMLDLDRFKHVNDVLGYRFGDLLLKRVGERLSQQMVRSGDLVARLGGDEFAVLLRHGDAALAQALATRLAAAFDEPMTLEEHTVDMGAGIGMACWPEQAEAGDGDEADLLLSHAEIAMYVAKRRTQGPLMYVPAIDAASTQTLSLLTELRRAVDQNELCLYLQPKLALGTGLVAGAEALVRWRHPLRGLVPPMDFIPFAEQTGFIRTLTIWVFEEAARRWLTLHAEGLAIRLSVNLSTRDLLDQDLPQKFEALLQKHGVPAEAFCLEITESVIMDDPQRALGTLNRLSAQGFKLSIDDFGTGYSSLAYLKRLPVDELKIDKSFVLSMEDDLDDAKIVRSTIDLAHNLGLSVVAEGVENAKVWEMLRELDCDEAQGYHMGRPMPAAEFLAWSVAWRARMHAQAGAAIHPQAVLH